MSKNVEIIKGFLYETDVENPVFKHKWIHDPNTNQCIGVLIAHNFVEEGRIAIGWSLSCKNDLFKKTKALEIATERASKYMKSTNIESTYIPKDERTFEPHSFNVPPKILDDFIDFYDRCKIYFKDKQMPDWEDSLKMKLCINAAEEMRKKECVE